MDRDPAKDIARKARRRRRIGDSVCPHCGERDPRALQRRGSLVACYEFWRLQDGRDTTEAHHPAGQHNLPNTVRIPGNDHRVLSCDQLGWPQETLRNADGSPLLKAAAAIRGWLDVLRLLIDRVVGWIPEFLETIDGRLRKHVGRYWWREVDGAW